jgi:signal transduction histidine kinase
MKLLTKINRNFLITSLLLFSICSVLFYFLLRDLIYSGTDEDLIDTKDEIIQFVQQRGKLPAAQSFAGDRLEIQIANAAEKIYEEPRDTFIYDSIEQESVLYRQLSFPVRFQNENYVITVGESQFESDDLITTILEYMLIFISALFAMFYFINRKTSLNVWLAFNDTLEKLKSFDLTGQNKTSFSHTGISEFEELNQSLNRMTERIYSDYSRLKQFTENASHEIQTPLSIIRGKIEMMIQSEHLTEEQMNSIQKINEAVSRLSRLNSALLTLTKIENHQFTDTDEIHLASFVRNKFRILEEMIQQKNITVTIQADEDVYMRMHGSLADLLFDNLIGNALKHNQENTRLYGQGFISISIQRNQFTISNSGEPLRIPTEKLFDRFVKNNQSSDSLGLGLAIVKQICVSYNFTVQFFSEKNIHKITITF